MKIDYEELQMAMSSHDPMGLGQFYLDTTTGEVLLVSDWVEDQARHYDDPNAIEDESFRLAWYLLWDEGEVGKELSDMEVQTMSQQADTYLKHILTVPEADSRDAYQDMADFMDTVTNSRLHERLEAALNGRKPLCRFKDVLYDYQDERESWFIFSAQRWHERIDG